MIIKKIVFLFICFLSFGANAVAIPRSAGQDARVQEVKYSPDNVTVVGVKSGVATLIQLSQGEYVIGEDTGVGIGDPMAWDIAIKGNNVFLRPIAEDPDTNISLVTNKHTYSIQLKYDENKPTYILRYLYDNPKQVTSIFNQSKSLKIPCSTPVFNGEYEVKGSKSIKPTSIWDNGEFTCFKWHNNNDLPVVFRVLPDGNEQLVNYHMDSDTGVMVVHETANEFVLRLGDEVMNVRPKIKLIRPYKNSSIIKQEGN